VGRTDTAAAQAGQQEGEVTVADIVAHQFLADKAEAIRTTARNAVFEIGKHLTEAREKCPHGKWLPWLRDEFGWSHTTADKYMSIHAAIAAGKLQPKLQFGLSISSLALLAAPSTPETAVNEVVEQAKVGRKVPHSRVKAIVAEHKPEPKPGAPPSSPPQAPVPAPPAPQRFDVPTTGPSSSASTTANGPKPLACWRSRGASGPATPGQTSSPCATGSKNTRCPWWRSRGTRVPMQRGRRRCKKLS
jgi:hypothetical protein